MGFKLFSTDFLFVFKVTSIKTRFVILTLHKLVMLIGRPKPQPLIGPVRDDGLQEVEKMVKSVK
jgi:hypothetical protein